LVGEKKRSREVVAMNVELLNSAANTLISLGWEFGDVNLLPSLDVNANLANVFSRSDCFSRDQQTLFDASAEDIPPQIVPSQLGQRELSKRRKGTEEERRFSESEQMASDQDISILSNKFKRY
jgi:hypothetical protein